MLKRDLIEYPFAWVYIGVGLILALVELITVFLACSYVAQINRSSQKNLAWFFSMIICSPFFCKMLQTAKTSEDVHQGRWWRQQIPSRWERFKRWSGDLKAKHWRENCQSPKGTRLLPHLVNISLPSQVAPLDQVENMANKWQVTRWFQNQNIHILKIFATKKATSILQDFTPVATKQTSKFSTNQSPVVKSSCHPGWGSVSD